MLRSALRYPVALLVALVVTVAIFSFMQRLISGNPLQVATDSVPVSVNIYQPPPLAQTPPQQAPQDAVAAESVAEPVMAPLSVSGVTCHLPTM